MNSQCYAKSGVTMHVTTSENNQLINIFPWLAICETRYVSHAPYRNTNINVPIGLSTEYK